MHTITINESKVATFKITEPNRDEVESDVFYMNVDRKNCRVNVQLCID